MYRKNDTFKPECVHRELRSGKKYKNVHDKPHVAIKKLNTKQRQTLKKSTNSDYDGDVDKNSNKYYQRERFMNNILEIDSHKVQKIAIAIDSPTYHVYEMVLEQFKEIKKRNGKVPNVKVICINGDPKYGATEEKKSEEFEIYTKRVDLADYIKTMKQSNIGLVWVDSMSAYKNRYNGKCSSTQELFKLMHEMELFNDTIIMWNAHNSRKNSGDPKKHFRSASLDFQRFGYITSPIQFEFDSENVFLNESNNCQTYYREYVDRKAKMVYHEFIVKKINMPFYIYFD
jgi:hypothetical protein